MPHAHGAATEQAPRSRGCLGWPEIAASTTSAGRPGVGSSGRWSPVRAVISALDGLSRFDEVTLRLESADDSTNRDIITVMACHHHEESEQTNRCRSLREPPSLPGAHIVRTARPGLHSVCGHRRTDCSNVRRQPSSNPNHRCSISPSYRSSLLRKAGRSRPDPRAGRARCADRVGDGRRRRTGRRRVLRPAHLQATIQRSLKRASAAIFGDLALRLLADNN